VQARSGYVREGRPAREYRFFGGLEVLFREKKRKIAVKNAKQTPKSAKFRVFCRFLGGRSI
jgi:hypothetical protein